MSDKIPKKLLSEMDTHLLEVIAATRAGFKSKAAIFEHCGKITVVRCTRRARVSARAQVQHFELTIGRPNAAERKFVKRWIAAGKCLPAKLYKAYPARKRCRCA